MFRSLVARSLLDQDLALRYRLPCGSRENSLWLDWLESLIIFRAFLWQQFQRGSGFFFDFKLLSNNDLYWTPYFNVVSISSSRVCYLNSCSAGRVGIFGTRLGIFWESFCDTTLSAHCLNNSLWVKYTIMFKASEIMAYIPFLTAKEGSMMEGANLQWQLIMGRFT